MVTPMVTDLGLRVLTNLFLYTLFSSPLMPSSATDSHDLVSSSSFLPLYFLCLYLWQSTYVYNWYRSGCTLLAYNQSLVLNVFHPHYTTSPQFSTEEKGKSPPLLSIIVRLREVLLNWWCCSFLIPEQASKCFFQALQNSKCGGPLYQAHQAFWVCAQHPHFCAPRRNFS